MKISINIPDKKLRQLVKTMAEYEIPAAFAVSKLKQYIRKTEHAESKFVADFVYPNRETAIRAATRFLDNSVKTEVQGAKTEVQGAKTEVQAAFFSFKAGRRIAVERFALDLPGRVWMCKPPFMPTIIPSARFINQLDWDKLSKTQKDAMQRKAA